MYLKEVAAWSPIVFHRNDGIVSRFPQTDRIGGILKMENFYEKNTDIYKKGFEFNNDKSFFENFQKLEQNVKMPHMINFFGSENSDYANVVNTSRNAYLSSMVIFECENVLYSLAVKDNSVNVLNSLMVNVHNNNIYFATGVVSSYNIFYSRYITNSNNIWFSTNLIGCTECLNCSELVNKKYCIDNREYSKQDYGDKKKEILGQKDIFLKKYKELPLDGNHVDCDNVSGNFIFSSENIEHGYYVNNVSNGRNLFFTGGKNGNEEMYDIFNGGAPSSSHIYGVNGVGNGSENVYIGANLPACNNVYYSFFLQECSYCLGCIGLKNQSYLFLTNNTQKRNGI